MIIGITILIFIVLFILLAVLTFARDLLASFLSSIVRIFKKKDRMNTTNEGRQTIRKRPRARKKVFADTDGEYVDFEEVKKQTD